MVDELALNLDAERGMRAEVLLRDELLTEAFDDLERDYLEAWKNTAARDTDGRERLWQAFQLVGKVRTHLQQVAANGQLAQRELNDLAR